MREANLEAAKRENAWEASARMDSSIKKCTGFLKKVKLLPDQNIDALLRELESINMAKYVSEVVNNLVDVRYTRSSDIFKCCQVASIMVQRHGAAEVSQPMLAGLIKTFEMHARGGSWRNKNRERTQALTAAAAQASTAAASGATSGNLAKDAVAAAATSGVSAADVEEEKQLTLRKRSCLRLLLELYLCGVSTDIKPLLGVLSDLISCDTRNDPDDSNTIIQLLCSFLKHAAEPLMKLQSKEVSEQRRLAELPLRIDHPEYLSAPQREHLLNKMFLPYAQMMHERLKSYHGDLAKLEKRAARVQMMRGDIPSDMLDERRSLKERLSNLHAQVATYFDLLDQDLPTLPTITAAEDELLNLVSLESSDTNALAMGDENLGPWDDADTKAFYEELVDLRLVVPPVLLQEGNEKEKARLRKEKARSDAGGDANVEEEEEEKDGPAASPSSSKSIKSLLEDDSEATWNMSIEELEAKLATMQQARAAQAQTHAAAGSRSRRTPFDAYSSQDVYEDEEGNPILPDAYFAGKGEKRSHPMETLLAEMPHSLNRESVDALAERFCYLNTRNNRMRLVEAMYTLPRQRADEIPYWCRMLATFHQHMTHDMTDELLALLTAEFYRQLRAKTQLNRLESRMRNLRFIGEMVKFRLAPATLALRCWHALLTQFNASNAQLIAFLLEQCGRFLYRTPATHMRTVAFLERTQALREQKVMDRTTSLMLDNAFSAVKPPPPSAQSIRQPKVRSVLHQFIRKSIFADLTPTDVDKMLKRLRALDWEGVELKKQKKAQENNSQQQANQSNTTQSTTSQPDNQQQFNTPNGAPSPNSIHASSSSPSPAAAAASPAPGVPPPDDARLLVIKCLSNPSNVRFSCLSALALLVAGLDHIHQVGCAVLDNVLEEIRVGLEMNRYSQNQRRILSAHYLAELYNHKVCDAQVIFDTLYLFITFGHELDEAGNLTSKLDPPSDTFRVRLVIAMLEACGSNFSTGQTKHRLDRFLLYFQRYLFLKEIIPIDLEFAVAELLEKLRPGYVRASSLEDVSRRIADLERAKLPVPDRLTSLAAETTQAATSAETSEAETIDEEEEDEEEEGGEEEIEVEDTKETTETAHEVGEGRASSLLDAAAAALEDASSDEGDDEDSDDESISSDSDSDDDDSDEWERSGRGVVRAKEDREFQQEYERMLSDAVESAKFQPRISSIGTVEAVTTAADKTLHAASPSPSPPSRPVTVDGEEAVPFRFLTRGHAKKATVARQLYVPASSDMATSTSANQAQAAAEKETLKKLVLAGLQRSAREQAEEERKLALNPQYAIAKDKKDGVIQNFSHRERDPSHRDDYEKIHQGMGRKAKKEDHSLKVESFAFASEETLTSSRVTLQGMRSSHERKK